MIKICTSKTLLAILLLCITEITTAQRNQYYRHYDDRNNQRLDQRSYGQDRNLRHHYRRGGMKNFNRGGGLRFQRFRNGCGRGMAYRNGFRDGMRLKQNYGYRFDAPNRHQQGRKIWRRSRSL